MRSIIFIDRTNLYYYGGNVHTVLTLPFVATVVKDIEIINPDAFEKQLDEFITKNKIEPMDLAIIFSRSSSFEKVIPVSPQKIDIDLERKKFIENVPFEEIMDQTHSDEKGTRFIAINKEFAYLVKTIVEKHHFQIVAIASVAALTPQGDISFNISSAQDFFKNSSTIKQLSFPLEENQVVDMDLYEDAPGPKKTNKKLYLLLVFFAILIGILVFLLLNRQSASEKKPTRKPSPSARTTGARTQTVSPTIKIATESAPIEIPRSTLTIRVLNGSGIPGQADEIKEKLTEKGYTNIVTGNAQALESTRTLIITKPRVSPGQKQEIQEIIQSIGTATISIQENANIEEDILITTARNLSSP
jgi:hypothetical protein